jgi:hypothetical protein
LSAGGDAGRRRRRCRRRSGTISDVEIGLPLERLQRVRADAGDQVGSFPEWM